MNTILTFLSTLLICTNIFAPFPMKSGEDFGFQPISTVLISQYETFDDEYRYTCYPNIRSADQLVNSSNEFNNNYDLINFGSLFEYHSDFVMNDAIAIVYNETDLNGNPFYNSSNTYPFSLYTDLGDYKTYSIEVLMQFKKVYDCYPHFYIYDGPGTNANLLLSGRYDEDIPDSYRSVVLKFELSVNSLSNFSFCIRYGATGLFRNEWDTRLLRVGIALSNNETQRDNLFFIYDDFEGNLY